MPPVIAANDPAAAPARIPKEALPQSGDFPWVVLATVAMNLLALALPLLMLQVFDRVLPNQSLDTLTILVFGTALAVAAEALLRLLRAFVMVWSAARFEHGLMCDAVSRLLAAPAEQTESGGYAERFKAIAALKEYFSGQPFLQLLDLPFTLLFLGMVALIGGWMVLVPIAAAGAFALVTFRFGKHHSALFRERSAADRRRSNFLVETLHGIHTVKAMAMEAFMLRRYERLQEACAALTRRLAAALDISSGIGGLFAPLTTVLVVAAGGYLVVGGHMTNGELAACIMLVQRSLGPLQRAGGLWINYQQTRALRDEVLPLFRHPPLARAEQEERAVPPEGRIELRSATYRLPGAAASVIDDVSLAVRPGEFVVVRGANGSGRSTLLHLMAGFAHPTGGEVLLDGERLSELPVPYLRSTIAYVPESAQLFQGTILDNISGFDPRREQRALEVARSLGLDRYVARLPRGWDTEVGGSAADSTPIGHRQRIAMVRALAVGAKVVLFDAANISMDSEGDASLRRYLEWIRGKVTVVMVTHRPSLQKLADRVLVMEAGRLTLEGKAGEAEARAAGAPPAAPGAVEGAERETALTAVSGEDDDEALWTRVRLAITHSFARRGDLALCLGELLRALDWRGDPRDVAEALPYFEDVLDLSGLLNCMAQLGYRSGSAKLRLTEIDPRLLPCLFLPAGGGALVLLEKRGEAYRVFDAAREAVRELANGGALAGEAYFFARREDEAPAGTSWAYRMLKRLQPYVGHAMLAALVFGLVMLPAPLFVMAVYGYVMPSGSLANLAMLTVGALLAVCTGSIFIVHRAAILAYIAGRIDYLFGTAIFKQILGLAPSMSETAALGAQIARLGSFESIRDLFSGPIVSTLLEAPALLAFAIALGILNPLGLFVVALTLALYAALYWLLGSMVDARVAELSRRTTRRHEFLVETVAKLRAIRECGAEATWLARFREISAAATMQGYRVGRISAALSAGGYLITTLGTLAVLAVSIVAAAYGNAGVGTAIASMMLAWRVIGPLQTAFVNLTRIDRVRNAADQMDRLMALRTERQAAAVPGGRRNFRGRVELERVSFRYSLDTDPALVGASLSVEAGKLVAITGPNGGGKSTLLKLLAGLYAPQAGSMRLDGMDLRQIDPLELRRAIGYVPQESSLFRGTIAQNLRLVRPAATEEELMRALALAGALNDIGLLRDGIHTRVGDGSSERLPASLRQKLSLARAYLTRAPVMLFDEPANTLDMEGDRWFIDALRQLKGKATIFLVTHRPSHIRLADTAVVLQAGYVRLVGTPEEALKGLGIAA